MPARCRRVPCLLVALLLSTTAPALSATGPTTPTFLLAWGNPGNPGSAPGQLSFPIRVATDGFGNVYVASDDHRIQKFTSAGTYLTKWGSLGSGNGQFNNPSAVATDGSGNVYVADQLNHRIQKFTGAGAYVAQWGALGSGNGQFNNPLGVGIDVAGSVYVADASNHRIQKFTNTGTYVTQWGTNGTGNGQFASPFSVAADAVGNIYVTDQNNHRVQKFDNTGNFLTKWGFLGSVGNGLFNLPRGVAVDAAGNVYVTDYNNNRIQKFSGAGAALSQAALSYLLKWGALGSGNGQFNFPNGLATDVSSKLYVTDVSNSRIQKFDFLGNFITKWGTAGSGNGQFNYPAGVATDAVGNVYVVEYQGNRVQKFAGDGTYLTQWGSQGSGNGQFNNPQAVATDAAGNVYVADENNSRIQKFDGIGTYLTQWGSAGSGNGQFASLTSVATDAFGNVYALSNTRVQKFTSTGTYLTQWGTGGTGNGQFLDAFGVATDVSGNVYVTEYGNRRVQKFTSSGAFLAKWGTSGAGDGQFLGPIGVATDVAGNVYVADHGTHRVQKFATPPLIALVSDVGNDQGGQTRLRILRSSADASGSGTTITGYAVYRRVDPLPGPARARPAAPAGLALEGWDYVGTQPAAGDAVYSMVVPTLTDANATSFNYTAYMVRGLTPDPLTHYASTEEYGCSIDNLSPPAPTPFTAAYEADATHLHWGVSTASDFATFRLYRGASSDFVPGPGSLVTATTDTGFADVGPAGGFYKLSAVDLNGNEGSFASLGPAQTTAVSGEVSPIFVLEGVRPNPASGRDLTVRFVLPIAAAARLELFDVSGRSVSAREVGSLGPGSHAVSLAEQAMFRPGLYFLRLTQGANEKTMRVTVLD